MSDDPYTDHAPCERPVGDIAGWGNPALRDELWREKFFHGGGVRRVTIPDDGGERRW